MTPYEVFLKVFKPDREERRRRIKHEVDFMLPSMPMVKACQAYEFDFFKPLIDKGIITVQQMHNAAQRYYLGKSKSGKPIFWMIDDMMKPLDALIGSDVWISTLLKNREPLLQYWIVKHCLFGLHLICDSEDMPVSIVESERSAVILSELFPENIWLAVMSASYFTIDLLKPLVGRKVKVFPDTDNTMSNYVNWLDLARMAHDKYHIDIGVSYYLEEHATAEQKERKIDLVDFIIESRSKST